jgi:archaellum component FlaC
MSDAPRATATATASVAGFPEGAKGVTPPTNPSGTGGFLSDVIVELGFADAETVERAVEGARAPGRTVDLILLEGGALTEDELSRAIAERHGFDHVDLDEFEVNMDAARLIGRSTARRYRAAPIEIATDGALIVAVADPADALGIGDIEVITKSETRVAVASGSAIDALAEGLPEAGTRQPAATRPGLAAGASPASPASTVPPASDLSGDASLADGNATVPALTTEVGELEADRERRKAEARCAALEDELEEARDLIRDQSAQAEGERGRLLTQLAETERERDRLRGAVEEITQERDMLRETSERSQPDIDRLRAEIRELEGADSRAETARLALAQQHKESEREREQNARLERKLREQLEAAKERCAALERRFSRATAAADAVNALADDLAALHEALTEDDLGHGA